MRSRIGQDSWVAEADRVGRNVVAGKSAAIFFAPIIFQTFSLIECDMYDAAMLGRGEILHLHHTFVESPKWGERLEIAGFHKAEVVWVDAINIVHNHPLIFADALPNIRRLAAAIFAIDLLIYIIFVMIDAVGNHIFYAARILLSYVRHEVAAIWHRANISIEHLNGGVRIFKKELRFGLERGERLVGITII